MGMLYLYCKSFIIHDVTQPGERTTGWRLGGSQAQRLLSPLGGWVSLPSPSRCWPVRKLYWAVVPRVCIGVSLCRDGWLHHWPCNWTSSPALCLAPEVRMAQSSILLITWLFFSGDQPPSWSYLGVHPGAPYPPVSPHALSSVCPSMTFNSQPVGFLLPEVGLFCTQQAPGDGRHATWRRP